MKKEQKSGFSLIETLVSVLLLVVLVIGSAMMLYRTGAQIQLMGNKHVAMERARTMMEALRDLKVDVDSEDGDVIRVFCE